MSRPGLYKFQILIMAALMCRFAVGCATDTPIRKSQVKIMPAAALGPPTIVDDVFSVSDDVKSEKREAQNIELYFIIYDERYLTSSDAETILAFDNFSPDRFIILTWQEALQGVYEIERSLPSWGKENPKALSAWAGQMGLIRSELSAALPIDSGYRNGDGDNVLNYAHP